MTYRSTFTALASTTLVILAGCAAQGSPGADISSACALIPGKDLQVSHETVLTGDRTAGTTSAFMYELQLAINPKNSKQMVISGIYSRPPAGDDPDKLPQEVLAFNSADGGASWQKSPLPPFPMVDGKKPFAGDPTVVYSKKGTAMYLTYTKPNSAHLSTDGGKTWSQPVKMTDEGLDHWMVAGDFTDGPHGGNVYAWGMGTKDIKPLAEGQAWDPKNSNYQMRLLRTQDEGRTWTDKIVTTTVELGIVGHGLNSVSDVVISRGGKVYLPFHSWDNVDFGKNQGQWMVSTDDGGNTFSKPHKIVKKDGTPLMSQLAGQYPGYAVDATSGPFGDRLYIVWYDSTLANTPSYQILFSHSDDRGITWADPRVLDSGLAKIDQSHPDLRVNDRGVLVIAWYKFTPVGPDSTKDGVKYQDIAYNRYVTASLDGGRTFLPIKKLMSQDSRSSAVFNPGYGWGVSHVRFGDYFNVLATPDGSFHTVWMGGQGPTQIWYAPFRVECGGKPAAVRK